jgi:hypothetical protein
LTATTTIKMDCSAALDQLISSLSFAWFSNSALVADLVGTARVVDISIGDMRIRQWGIDAPEHAQTCE